MQRNGVYQNRTYTWSGTDLTSSTEPETGTTTYQYDGNHHVTLRTDAKGQQTTYTYDAYERLTEVQHYAAPTCQYCQPQEQVNQRVFYTYDVNPLDPGNYTNSWGRLAGVSYQQQNATANQFAYYYSYNQAGGGTTDTFQATNAGNTLVNLAATYVWDTQGRMTNMTYPSGAQLAYQYDAMGRLSQITSPNYPSSNQGYNVAVTASYTAASQLSSLQYGTNYGGPFTESRTYNTLMQTIRMTTTSYQGTLMDMQYNYTTGQNNGRVSSTTDNVLGETVNYTYDMWNRLSSATATNGNWGETYTFDNFGNLTGKTPSVGSAPSMNVPANNSNQPTGIGSFDANGNSLGGNPYYPNTWDVENRLVATATSTQSSTYSYDPWGRRMWKEIPGQVDSQNNQLTNTTCEIYFYGVTGQKLETYSCSYTGGGFVMSLEGINVYFGKKLLQSKGAWVATDKLGSVRYSSSLGSMSYYPYGEERETPNTANGVEKFGTYTRDAVGQDYAEQRYYNSSLGAFWSPDPLISGTARTGFRPSFRAVNPKDPDTWNRYSYADNDPVDRRDPTGLDPDPTSQDPDCASLLTKINYIVFGNNTTLGPSKGLITRFYQQIYGQIAPGQPGWQTHEDQIVGLQKKLKEKMTDYIDDKCPPPSNWGIFDYWANKPAPSPANYKGPAGVPNMMQWLVTTVGSGIFYQMLSGLEDAFEDLLPEIEVIVGVADSTITYGGVVGGDDDPSDSDDNAVQVSKLAHPGLNLALPGEYDGYGLSAAPELRQADRLAAYSADTAALYVRALGRRAKPDAKRVGALSGRN